MPQALTIFGGGPECQDRWNAYNQAVQQREREELQLYVNRQKELATSQATAPLQQQIADLTTQIKKMQEQMQADNTAAMQARTAAHTQGLEYGAGMGVGGTLLLFAVIFGLKKIVSSFTITKKPQAQGAAAGR
jgi:hypothetical protein